MWCETSAPQRTQEGSRQGAPGVRREQRGREGPGLPEAAGSRACRGGARVVGGDPAARWERGPSESHSRERRCFPKLSNVSKGQHLFKNRLCPRRSQFLSRQKGGRGRRPGAFSCWDFTGGPLLTLRGSPRLRGSAASWARQLVVVSDQHLVLHVASVPCDANGGEGGTKRRGLVKGAAVGVTTLLQNQKMNGPQFITDTGQDNC